MNKKTFVFLAMIVNIISESNVIASNANLTLFNAIRIAQQNSYDATLARYSFLASYWTYRSFKAELLPSVNLSGGLMNFDHSIVEARNYEDGKVSYVGNNSLSNNLTLSVDQKIAATDEMKQKANQVITK